MVKKPLAQVAVASIKTAKQRASSKTAIHQIKRGVLSPFKI